MKPNIGISEKNLQQVTTLLTTLLANEMVLYTKTRKSHWNISGDSFMELHKLLEDQYKQLEVSIDEIAERIGKLGEKTVGTMQEFMKLSSIKENPDKYSPSKDMIRELLGDHETIIVELRKDIEASAEKNQDVGTADLLTDLVKQHETTAWILRKYLN
jgi:starvation-inducible DNA-binding protein